MVRKHTIDMPPGTRRTYRVTRGRARAMGVSLPPAVSHGSRHVPGSAGEQMTGQRANRPTGKQGLRMSFLALLIALLPINALAQDVDHGGHTVHDRAINFKVLFDQLEAQLVHGELGSRWDSRSWIGGDSNRLLVRTEGEAVDGVLDTAEAQVLYSRAFSPWWEAVAGVRFDARPAAVAYVVRDRRSGPGAAVHRRAGHRIHRAVGPLRGAPRARARPAHHAAHWFSSRSSSSACRARTIRIAASAPASAPARSDSASAMNSGASSRRTRAWSGTGSCSAPATPPAREAPTPAAGTSSAASGGGSKWKLATGNCQLLVAS